MKVPRRSLRAKKILHKKIIKYYFENPEANSYNEMQEKFNVYKETLRKVLSKEFERRLENSLTRKEINNEKQDSKK